MALGATDTELLMYSASPGLIAAAAELPDMGDRVILTVIHDDEEHVVEIAYGVNLREALLAEGFPVYGSISKHANCGGRGLCSTCTVEINPAPEATHWHDSAAVRFGYPRLSCCIEVTEPLTVGLLEDKRIWGQFFPRRLRPPE